MLILNDTEAQGSGGAERAATGEAGRWAVVPVLPTPGKGCHVEG